MVIIKKKLPWVKTFTKPVDKTVDKTNLELITTFKSSTAKILRLSKSKIGKDEKKHKLIFLFEV